MKRKNLYLTSAYTDQVKGQYIVLYEAENASIEGYKNSKFTVDIPYNDEVDEKIFI